MVHFAPGNAFLSVDAAFTAPATARRQSLDTPPADLTCIAAAFQVLEGALEEAHKDDEDDTADNWVSVSAVSSGRQCSTSVIWVDDLLK